MDLSSGYPFSLIKHGYPYHYPTLKENISCDIAIIGGGISGALAAYYLSKENLKVVVVDREHIGLGSTSLSTSLIQYEIDEHLFDLKQSIGKKNAEASYKLCLESVFKLAEICKELNSEFVFRKSIYLAKHKKDISTLLKEEKARQSIGINVFYIDSDELKKRFGITSSGALVSDIAAEMDVFILTHKIFESILKKGNNVFAQTEIKKITEHKKSAELTTLSGYLIQAKKIVFATGYESYLYLNKKVAQLYSTYTVISSPIPKQLLWKDRVLIWETARPYLYTRTTSDNRIIIGGRDEPFYDPQKRDNMIPEKSELLIKDFRKLLPHIPFEKDFTCAGTFAGTKDGLPYIGITPQYKHAYFSLGYGGNGITFSQIAGEIIRDLFLKKKSPFVDIFSFNR